MDFFLQLLGPCNHATPFHANLCDGKSTTRNECSWRHFATNPYITISKYAPENTVKDTVLAWDAGKNGDAKLFNAETRPNLICSLIQRSSYGYGNDRIHFTFRAILCFTGAFTESHGLRTFILAGLISQQREHSPWKRMKGKFICLRGFFGETFFLGGGRCREKAVGKQIMIHNQVLLITKKQEGSQKCWKKFSSQNFRTSSSNLLSASLCYHFFSQHFLS